MASKIAIYNLIAGHLGQDEVLSFPASGPLGDAILQFWDAARQDTLRANTWHCARKRVQLTPTADAPPFEYSYAFNLPGDFIRLVDLSITGFDGYDDYVREGQQILANDTPLNLIYIQDLHDVDYWDADLAMAFSVKLAAMAAVKITGDAALRDALMQQFGRMTDSAAQADGMEDPPLKFNEDSWISARWGNSFGDPDYGWN